MLEASYPARTSMDPIATLLVAAVGGVIGSIFTASVALAQFKEERAWEHRLRWYEDTIALLHELIWGAQVAQHKLLTKSTPEELREVLGKAHRHVDGLALASRKSDLYAHPEGKAALDCAIRATNESGELFRTVQQVGGRDPNGVFLAEMEKELIAAEAVLVREAREILFPRSGFRRVLNVSGAGPSVRTHNTRIGNRLSRR